MSGLIPSESALCYISVFHHLEDIRLDESGFRFSEFIRDARA